MKRRSFLTTMAGSAVVSNAIFGKKPNEYTNITDNFYPCLSISSRTVTSKSIEVEYVSYKVSVNESKFAPELVHERVPKTVTFSKDKYIEETQTDQSFYTQIPRVSSENWIDSIATEFIPEGEDIEIPILSRFVYNFNYENDWETVDSKQYNRHPIETLVDGVADCDGRITLLYTLLESLGYTVGYIIVPHHTAAIVPYNQFSEVVKETSEEDDIIRINNTKYLIVDPTYQSRPGNSDIEKNDIIFMYESEDGVLVNNIAKLKEHWEKTYEVLIENNAF